MDLLAVEVLLALIALKRGWRLAPLLLVAVPMAANGATPMLADALAPSTGAFFDPAATIDALAHAFALVGLALACWVGPSEAPVGGRPRPRATVPLYQI